MENDVLVNLYGREYPAEILHFVTDDTLLVVVLAGPYQNKTMVVNRLEIRPDGSQLPPAVAGDEGWPN